MVDIIFHVESPVTYWPGCTESIAVSFVRVDYFVLCLLRSYYVFLCQLKSYLTKYYKLNLSDINFNLYMHNFLYFILINSYTNYRHYDLYLPKWRLDDGLDLEDDSAPGGSFYSLTGRCSVWTCLDAVSLPSNYSILLA